MSAFLFRRVPSILDQEGQPRELVPQDLFHYDQLSRHPEAATVTIQGGLATASTYNRHSCHPHGADFTGMESTRFVGLESFPDSKGRPRSPAREPPRKQPMKI